MKLDDHITGQFDKNAPFNQSERFDEGEVSRCNICGRISDEEICEGCYEKERKENEIRQH